MAAIGLKVDNNPGHFLVTAVHGPWPPPSPLRKSQLFPTSLSFHHPICCPLNDSTALADPASTDFQSSVLNHSTVSPISRMIPLSAP